LEILIRVLRLRWNLVVEINTFTIRPDRYIYPRGDKTERENMSDEKREELLDFRRRQADQREKQWIKTILKARNFSGIETLQQGISFSEDLAKLIRV
jgi:hypothetical protein